MHGTKASRRILLLLILAMTTTNIQAQSTDKQQI